MDTGIFFLLLRQFSVIPNINYIFMTYPVMLVVLDLHQLELHFIKEKTYFIPKTHNCDDISCFIPVLIEHQITLYIWYLQSFYQLSSKVNISNYKC
jgi:hypothetical protein